MQLPVYLGLNPDSALPLSVERALDGICYSQNTVLNLAVAYSSFLIFESRIIMSSRSRLVLWTAPDQTHYHTSVSCLDLQADPSRRRWVLVSCPRAEWMSRFRRLISRQSGMLLDLNNAPLVLVFFRTLNSLMQAVY